MSLMGYFYLLNGLNFLDGYLTVTGVQFGILYERNPFVQSAIETYGLEPGLLMVKFAVFLTSALLVIWGQKIPNFTRVLMGTVCVVYTFAVSYMTALILMAAH